MFTENRLLQELEALQAKRLKTDPGDPQPPATIDVPTAGIGDLGAILESFAPSFTCPIYVTEPGREETVSPVFLDTLDTESVGTISEAEEEVFVEESRVDVTVPDVEAEKPVKLDPLVTDHAIRQGKLKLVSLAVRALLDANFSDAVGLCDIVSKQDPEFILKLALYTRNRLNIRKFANQLLGYACSKRECLPYVNKYFDAIIVLPTDLLTTVAELWKRTKSNYIPKKIRPTLQRKILSFSDFHFRKYQKRKAVITDDSGCSMDVINFKLLVKLLHMKDDKERIMKILGCRYPNNLEEFFNCKLSGEFDASKAGKRMKFDSILTWESYVSKHGNTAASWHYLLERNAVPYMALLKNLRNLLLCRVDEKHRYTALKKLTSLEEVSRCRIFPTEYLAAVNSIKNVCKKNFLEPAQDPSMNAYERRKAFRKIPLYQRKLASRKYPGMEEDAKVYIAAVNKAFKIASTVNVSPIPGRTVIFLWVDRTKRKTFVNDLLFLVILANRCEECQTFLVRGNDAREFQQPESLSQLEQMMEQFEETIADTDMGAKGYKLIGELMFNLLKEDEYRRKIDNFVMIGVEGECGSVAYDYASFYRTLNPQVKRILIGKYRSFWSSDNNDIYATAGTKEVLQYITSSGDDGQLAAVEQIHREFKLNEMLEDEAVETVVPPLRLPHIPSWRNVRVFISSTFTDMQSERDVLTRFVFPELRERARKMCINLYDVDLRWGINRSESGRAVKMCLEEARRSDIFIGIICNRYGYRVPSYDDLVSVQGLRWLRDYPPNASVTELEIMNGVFKRLSEMKDRAFFYFRNDKYLERVPPKLKSAFYSPDDESRSRLAQLKDFIKKSGLEIYNDYPCDFAGVQHGIPVLVNLDKFAQRVIDNVWNVLLSIRAELSVDERSDSQRHTFELRVSEINDNFVGNTQEDVVDELLKTLKGNSTVCITGPGGSGKSYTIARMVSKWRSAKLNGMRMVAVPVFCDMMNFVSCSRGGLGIIAYVCQVLSDVLHVDNVGNRHNLASLFQAFEDLCEAASRQRVALLLAFDSIESWDSSAYVPWFRFIHSKSSVVVSLSCNSEADTFVLQSAMEGYEGFTRYHLKGLDTLGRRRIVSSFLSKHFKHLDKAAGRNEMRTIVTKRGASLPLYLELACRDLLTQPRSIDEVAQVLTQLPQQINKLIEAVVAHTYQRFRCQVNVHMLLSILLLEETGRSEKELADMVYLYNLLPANAMEENIGELASRLGGFTLPDTFWSAFLAVLDDLSGFLGPRYGAGYIWLAHDCVRRSLQVVQSSRKDAEFVMALYLWMCCCTIDGRWSCTNSAYIVHLPRMLCRLERIAELQAVLGSDEFLAARCSHGFIEELLEDYEVAVQLCPSLEHRRKQLLLDSHLLRMYPGHYMDIMRRNYLTLHEPCPAVTYHAGAAIHSMGICGEMAALGCSDGVVRLMSLQSGRLLNEFIGHSGSVKCVLFIDGILVTGSEDATVCFWDVERRIRLKTASDHKLGVVQLALVADSELVASADMDGFLCTYGARSIATVLRWVQERNVPISSIAAHPSERLLFALNWARHINAYEPYTAECRMSFDCDWSSSMAMLGSSPAVLLNGNGFVQSFDLTYGDQAILPLGSAVSALAAKGEQIVVGYSTGSVALFNYGLAQEDRSLDSLGLPFAHKIASSQYGAVVTHANGSYTSIMNWDMAERIVEKASFTVSRASTKRLNIADVALDDRLCSLLYVPGTSMYLFHAFNFANLVEEQIFFKASRLIPKVLSPYKANHFDDVRSFALCVFSDRCLKVARYDTKDGKYFCTATSLLRAEQDDYSAVSLDAFDLRLPGQRRVCMALGTAKGKLSLYEFFGDVEADPFSPDSRKAHEAGLSSHDDVLLVSHYVRAGRITGISMIGPTETSDSLKIGVVSRQPAHISWWEYRRGGKLSCLYSLALDEDPLELFGSLLVQQSGHCTKFAPERGGRAVWKCRVELGEGISHARAAERNDGRVTFEKLYVTKRGEVKAYALPGCQEAIPPRQKHCGSVTSVHVLVDGLVSCSLDGTLVKHIMDQDDRLSRPPISIDQTIVDGKVHCCLLYPDGIVSCWERNKKWNRLFHMQTQAADAKLVYFSSSEVVLQSSSGIPTIIYYRDVDRPELQPDPRQRIHRLFWQRCGDVVYCAQPVFIADEITWKMRVYREDFSERTHQYLCTTTTMAVKIMGAGNRILLLTPDFQLLKSIRLKAEGPEPWEFTVKSSKQKLKNEKAADEEWIFLYADDQNRTSIQLPSADCICLVGDQLFCGDLDGYIWKLDLNGDWDGLGKRSKSEAKHLQSVTFICHAPRAGLIWSAGKDYTVKAWTTDLNPLKHFCFRGIPTQILPLRDNDEPVLVTCSDGGVYCLSL